MLNLPNIITLLRLALLPVLVWLLFLPFEWAAYSALGLFIFGALTDWLDGWIARKYNLITNFGTFLDPVADKIYVCTVLLMLVATDRITGPWVILAVLILVREFAVSGVREFLGPKGVKMPVTTLAKWKTATQMIASAVLIIGPLIPYGVSIGLASLSLATLLSLQTGATYLRFGIQHMKDY